MNALLSTATGSDSSNDEYCTAAGIPDKSWHCKVCSIMIQVSTVSILRQTSCVPFRNADGDSRPR